MQDTHDQGEITPLDTRRYDALGPVPEYVQPDGTRVKVVPHDVYVHQQKLIAKARRRRKAAEQSRKRGRP